MLSNKLASGGDFPYHCVSLLPRCYALHEPLLATERLQRLNGYHIVASQLLRHSMSLEIFDQLFAMLLKRSDPNALVLSLSRLYQAGEWAKHCVFACLSILFFSPCWSRFSLFSFRIF